MNPRTASNSVDEPGYSTSEVGRWLFRKRSFMPVPWLVLLLVLPHEFMPTFVTVAVALVAIVAAEALRVYAVGHAGSATRTRGDEVPELVIAGPFRHVRNPLYVANIALYSFVAVLFGFAWLAVVIAIVFAVQYRYIVAYEEATLMSTFGTPYLRYLRAVPRWIPAISPQHTSTGHRFSLGRALRSERSTLLAIVALPLLLIVKTSLLG